MMTHTGNKPHLCSICGKKYSQNSQLVEHMRSHTGIPTEYYTAYNFKVSVYMIFFYLQYLIIGETLQCNVCGKGYSTAGNLAAHMKTHTGIKPHVCGICSKGFYVANKLAKHMRTHTGERPYACNFCPKRFTSSDVMKVHTRIHTGEL